MNPRWLAWLAEVGEPRPPTFEFLIWSSARWREWERLNGRQPHGSKTDADQDDFTAWLLERK